MIVARRTFVPRQFVRAISIQPPSTTPVVEAKGTGTAQVADDVSQLGVVKSKKEVIQFTKDEPVMQSLGNPQSTLSITAPPSVPVFVKRGSLMSLYASQKAGVDTEFGSIVTSTLSLQQPLRRFLYGGINSSYQRIISTVPINILVSGYPAGGWLSKLNPNTTASATKTFCNLALDGTIDWAVFDPNALHVYTGNSLLISSQRFPKWIKDGKKRRTGLSQLFQSGYTLLTGRGYVSLLGSGSIFKLGLGENEQIYIKKDNLLASSIRDAGEFGSGAFESQLISNKTFAEQQKEKEQSESHVAVAQPVPTTWEKFTGFFKSAGSAISRSVATVSSYIVGNGEYINIKGPRMLLIQTSTGTDQFVYNTTRWNGRFGADIEDTEKFIKKEGDLANKTPESKPASKSESKLDTSDKPASPPA